MAKQLRLAPRRLKWAEERSGGVLVGSILRQDIRAENRYAKQLEGLVLRMGAEVRREIAKFFRQPYSKEFFGEDICRAPAKGVIPGAEDVVKELQFHGPSWTGVYSNSWQIEIAGQKGTGTRRGGNPKPVKGPKLTLAQVRRAASSSGQVDLEIRNLRQKTKKGYAEDTIEGRFTRGVKDGKKRYRNKKRWKSKTCKRPKINFGSSKKGCIF